MGCDGPQGSSSYGSSATLDRGGCRGKATLSMSCVAVLDGALVRPIFKGDVRLT